MKPSQFNPEHIWTNPQLPVHTYVGVTMVTNNISTDLWVPILLAAYIINSISARTCTLHTYRL